MRATSRQHRHRKLPHRGGVKRGLGALVVVSLLAGCQQRAEQVADYNSGLTLQCNKGFDALVREIASTPGIVASTYDRGSDTYRDDRNYSLFVVTKPDHPAHPAIFLRFLAQTSEGTRIGNSACGYGDLEAMRREVAAYSAFSRLLQSEEQCWLCGTEKLSPSVEGRLPPPPDSIIRTP